MWTNRVTRPVICMLSANEIFEQFQSDHDRTKNLYFLFKKQSIDNESSKSYKKKKIVQFNRTKLQHLLYDIVYTTTGNCII